MSRWDETYEERYQRRREEEREYRGDVTYDVWRSGGNVDRIDEDRVRSSHDNGLSHEQAARVELNAQRPRVDEEAEYYRQQEEEYYRQQQEDMPLPEPPQGIHKKEEV